MLGVFTTFGNGRAGMPCAPAGQRADGARAAEGQADVSAKIELVVCVG